MLVEYFIRNLPVFIILECQLVLYQTFKSILLVLQHKMLLFEMLLLCQNK